MQVDWKSTDYAYLTLRNKQRIEGWVKKRSKLMGEGKAVSLAKLGLKTYFIGKSGTVNRKEPVHTYLSRIADEGSFRWGNPDA